MFVKPCIAMIYSSKATQATLFSVSLLSRGDGRLNDTFFARP
jgi:hypothetical protein